MNLPYIKKTMSGKIFDVFNVIFMMALAFIMLFPFWTQLVLSFNDGLDALKGNLFFIPRKFTLSNYLYIFKKSNITRGFSISVLRVVVGTTTSLFFSGLLAYVTTVPFFTGRRFMRLVFLITMYFGGGLVPTFLVYSNLGLLNKFAVYWLPTLFSAYNMVLIASYINNLPPALSESARIDGASELFIYIRIIIPLAVPVLAAVAVFTAIMHWNSWFDVVVYNSGGKWDTLQVYLRRILLEAEQLSKLQNDQRAMAAYRNLTPGSIRAATTMIVTIPIILVYPFMQKYFIGGITLGAVKQ